MRAIIDASVALKWVLEEADSQQARDLLVHDILAAPDFLFVECANVLWVKARRSQISAAEATDSLAAIEAAPIRVISGSAHTAAALAMALNLNQSAYDCLYLAIALAERAVFVTADEAFVRVAGAHAVYRSSIKLLGS